MEGQGQRPSSCQPPRKRQKHSAFASTSSPTSTISALDIGSSSTSRESSYTPGRTQSSPNSSSTTATEVLAEDIASPNYTRSIQPVDAEDLGPLDFSGFGSDSCSDLLPSQIYWTGSALPPWDFSIPMNQVNPILLEEILR